MTKSEWGVGLFNYIDEDGKNAFGYGKALSDNPHDFWPDRECCTRKQVEAWEEACEKYNEFKV